jgi:hypothetical protein
MNKIADDWKDIAVYVPYIGGFCIVYGSLNCVTYYSQFNVAITQYIDFSEIITYFIKDILSIIVQLLLVMVTAVSYNAIKNSKLAAAVTFEIPLKTITDMTEHDTRRASELDQLMETVRGTKSSKKKRELLRHAEKMYSKLNRNVALTRKKLDRLKGQADMLRWVPRVIVVGMLVGIFYVLGWPHGLSLAIPLIIAFLLTFTSLHFYAFLTAYTASILICSAFFDALRDAERVKTGSNYGSAFRFEGQLIKSDSTKYMVGKTKDYVFYYDSKTHQTAIYQAQKVDFITVPTPP